MNCLPNKSALPNINKEYWFLEPKNELINIYGVIFTSSQFYVPGDKKKMEYLPMGNSQI